MDVKTAVLAAETEPRAQQTAPDDAPQDIWGMRLVRALPPGVTRPVATVWRRLAPALPMLALVVGLLVVVAGFDLREQYYKLPSESHILSFVHEGSLYSSRLAITLPQQSPIGYDGQFYYYVATHPDLIVSCARSTVGCPLDIPAFRGQRILYPMTAWLVALGNPHLVPYSLLAINLLAIVLTGWLIGRLCMLAGASPWLGTAAGLFSGEVLSLLRDLGDSFGLFWLVLAVYLVARSRYRWAALAVAAALLTREQFLFVVPFLVLPVLAQRKWGTLVVTAAIALVPFVVWQIVLFALYGQWALRAGSQQAQLVAIPFAGLWRERSFPDFGFIVLGAVIPLVLALVIAVLVVWYDGPCSLLRDPLPLMVLVYGGLMCFTYWFQWADMWGPSRLVAPAVLLALPLVARLPLSPLRAAYATLVAASGLAPFIIVMR